MTMIIVENPQTYGLETLGGKDVDHIAWYDVERVPRNKHMMDIVTDDGTTYRWSQNMDSDPWTFEQRIKPDGRPDPTTRPLPSKIATLIERSPDVLYR